MRINIDLFDEEAVTLRRILKRTISKFNAQYKCGVNISQDRAILNQWHIKLLVELDIQLNQLGK